VSPCCYLVYGNKLFTNCSRRPNVNWPSRPRTKSLFRLLDVCCRLFAERATRRADESIEQRIPEAQMEVNADPPPFGFFGSGDSSLIERN
jgi:hypothetical protein